MSGGHFDYGQYRIEKIADEIELHLDRQGKEIPIDCRWCSPDYYDNNPDKKFYPMESPEIQDRMREAIKALRIAYVYAQRIDWYLSGDDGDDDSFLKRLEEDLAKIK